MLRIIYSWLRGRRVGEVRYIHDRPLVVGGMGCMLPMPLWTDAERSTLRYGVRCQTWTGYQWVTGPRTEVSEALYKNLGVLNVVAHR